MQSQLDLAGFSIYVYVEQVLIALMVRIEGEWMAEGWVKLYDCSFVQIKRLETLIFSLCV